MRNALGHVTSVLLLGGRSEIGLAIVDALVRGGADRVVLAARGGVDDAILERVRANARTPSAATVTSLAFDGAVPETHPGVVDEAVARLGDVDVVVDAFGRLGSNAEFEADPVAAARSIAGNFGGHVSIGLLVADRLRRQAHGTLVVLSSVAGVRVRRANYVYGAAKAGLDGFATALGDRLAGSGASVLVVRPGFVHDRMTAGVPAAPMATTPEAVAKAVVGALRADREVVWVPPALAPVFGVLRNAPRALWRRMPR